MSMQRRDFLKTIGAASTVAAIPGCATMGGTRGKVVVIGGGYGGATAAKYIRMWSDGGVDVTVVEPNPEFIARPISKLVVLVPPFSVDLILPGVQSVDPALQRLVPRCEPLDLLLDPLPSARPDDLIAATSR